jgi:hypothetical protein
MFRCPNIPESLVKPVALPALRATSRQGLENSPIRQAVDKASDKPFDQTSFSSKPIPMTSNVRSNAKQLGFFVARFTTTYVVRK